MVLKLTPNSLFQDPSKAVDLVKLSAPQTLRRARGERKRDVRDQRKTESAVAAIAGLDHETEIYGFTKGQFSLLQLLQAVFLVTGPAHLSLSTWTAASHEIESCPRCKRGGTSWACGCSLIFRWPGGNRP